MLDSAGYGSFSITKSLSIIAPVGVYAGIFSPPRSGDAIDITAGSTDTVILRGLTLNSQGSFENGIDFQTGGTLHIENCVINGFNSAGHAGVVFLGQGNLEVKDSVMRGDFDGIFVGGSGARASIDQVRLEGNSVAGLLVTGGAKVTVRNSLASGSFVGFYAATNAALSAELNIENCLASNNLIGIQASSRMSGIALVRVSNSLVTDNSLFGLRNVDVGSPAILLSRANNTVEGNGTDEAGVISLYNAR